MVTTRQTLRDRSNHKVVHSEIITESRYYFRVRKLSGQALRNLAYHHKSTEPSPDGKGKDAQKGP